MSPLRMLLAEDHVLMRAGLRLLLEQMDEVTVVAEASDGVEALHLLTLHRPDIAVLDIAMPFLTGLEVAARVQVELPEVRVIILSMYATGSYVQQALRAGAKGYLLKDAAPVELALAVRAVAGGEIYLSSAVTSQMVQQFVQGPDVQRVADRRSLAQVGVVQQFVQGPDVQRPGLEQLTPRQRTILRQIAEGQTTQEIARTLQISAKTVEGHRAQLMERLDIREVAGLVRFAIRMGLIDHND
ncbi:MAG: response regulator transcription factor [Chloroflexales bacterium]